MKYLPLFFVLLLFACGNGTNDAEKENITPKKDTLKVLTEYEELNNAIKKEPNNALLYLKRANYFFKNRNIDESLADVKRTIKVDSTISNVYLLYADLSFTKGEFRKSMELLQKAINLDDKNIEAYLKKAELLLYAKQYKKSMKSINKALEIDVHYAPTYFMKGTCYKLAGDTAHAVSSFQTVIEQDPEYYKAYMELGEMYAAIHNSMAIDYYNNAIKLKPSSVDAIYAKSYFIQEHGQPEKAKEGYDLMLKIDPNNSLAFYNKGYINLVYETNYDEAINNFTQAISLNPKYVEAYYNRGYCYELKEDFELARKDYKTALKINPSYTLAAKGMSSILGK